MHVKCCKCTTQFNITTDLILDKTVHLAHVYTWQWLAPSVLEDGGYTEDIHMADST